MTQFRTIAGPSEGTQELAEVITNVALGISLERLLKSHFDITEEDIEEFSYQKIGESQHLTHESGRRGYSFVFGKTHIVDYDTLKEELLNTKTITHESHFYNVNRSALAWRAIG